MDQVKPFIYFLLGLMIFQSPVSAQTFSGPCKEINVTIELVQEEQPTSALKIFFKENGSYKIQVLDSKGKITVYKNLIIRDLEIGEYDLIITDQEDSNRCPYYKRIKIEGR